MSWRERRERRRVRLLERRALAGDAAARDELARRTAELAAQLGHRRPRREGFTVAIEIPTSSPRGGCTA